MSHKITVTVLSGGHIGQRITVKTKHTESTGILQGFVHDTEAYNDSNYNGANWINGSTATTITLLPNQRIIAEMKDEVIVHGPGN